MAFASASDLATVVVDVGSSTARMGLAGDDRPRAVFPSIVGAVGDDGSVEDALLWAADKEARRAVVAGEVQAWDDLERVWAHGLAQLEREASETPLLVVEASLGSREQRARQAQLAFETLGAPALFLSKQAPLALYSVARSTGTVVHVGASETTVVPVQDGFALQTHAARTPVGGDAVAEHLLAAVEGAQAVALPHAFSKKVLRDGTVKLTAVNRAVTDSFAAAARRSVAAELAAAAVAVRSGGDEAAAEEQEAPAVTHTLPDGTAVEVGAAERLAAGELLLDPSGLELEGDEAPVPLPRLVLESALKCDLDVRREMLHNVLLCGGGSAVEGLPARLGREVGKLAALTPPSYKTVAVAPPMAERAVASWLGGSILGSLSSFADLAVSKAEYEEHGAGVLGRKCP